MQNNKLKILIVGYLPPPQEGTAKITEIIVNSEYLKSNFQIEFLSLRKRKNATERGKFAGLNILYNLANVFDYILKISKFNPNIIYLPLAQNKLGFLRDSIFILTGKIFGKKLCVHFHGGNFDLFYQQQNVFYKWYISFVVRKINRLIVLAEKFKCQFREFLCPEKINVLYNCLPEIPQSIENSNQSRSEKKDKIRILFIGYLSKAKGALDLVQAIPLVIAEYKKPIEFILYGQPVDIERNITFIPEPHFGYTKIKKLIEEKNLYGYVKIYTDISFYEKDRLFRESDMFVFPTYSEGCGLVVLEAMAYGLPVITTRVGALEEMLTEMENCFFVQPGDYKNLAQTILILAEDENLRQKMSVTNYRTMKNKFKTEDFCRQLSEIWVDLYTKGARNIQGGKYAIIL